MRWPIFLPVFLGACTGSLVPVGCSGVALHVEQQPQPAVKPAPKPAPVASPDAGGPSCATAAANIARLGGCGLVPKTMTFEAACQRLNGQTEADGTPIRGLDVGCLTAAQSCAEAKLCD